MWLPRLPARYPPDCPSRSRRPSSNFITGPLLANPRRLGGELHREPAGVWSAHSVRGYRILYRDEEHRVVKVLNVDRRADVYRSR